MSGSPTRHDPPFRPLDPKTRLCRACEPNEPIGPDDPRHVNFDEVRGDSTGV
ncbi:hypothetical protein FTUN_1891 [Frigoriglobus tundricola]|uniref:Uncharacterized protein n=1 Tax=Frigoriglobus tundricola TaxID=2774151 RepID=A0A6M5YM99_9BACT|nr:hypothetical protein FTUN_1891 [Frigoriglobus tundricola]